MTFLDYFFFNQKVGHMTVFLFLEMKNSQKVSKILNIHFLYKIMER